MSHMAALIEYSLQIIVCACLMFYCVMESGVVFNSDVRKTGFCKKELSYILAAACGVGAKSLFKNRYIFKNVYMF